MKTKTMEKPKKKEGKTILAAKPAGPKKESSCQPMGSNMKSFSSCCGGHHHH